MSEADRCGVPGIILDSCVRFGSTDSIDRDTPYSVPYLPSVQICKSLCRHPSENRNLIVVQEGVVTECFKGLPDETNNALFHIYAMHPQNTPNPVTRSVLRNVPLKLFRAVRVILSQFSRAEFRFEIKTALNSLNMVKRLEALKTEMLGATHLLPRRRTLAMAL